MTTFHMTFRGNGNEMNVAQSKQWNLGFKDGLAYTLQNFTLEKGCKAFPEFINGRNGYYKNGWAEGGISGRGQVIDAIYPGLKTLVLRDGYYELEYFDGRFEKVFLK